MSPTTKTVFYINTHSHILTLTRVHIHFVNLEETRSAVYSVRTDCPFDSRGSPGRGQGRGTTLAFQSPRHSAVHHSSLSLSGCQESMSLTMGTSALSQQHHTPTRRYAHINVINKYPVAKYIQFLIRRQWGGGYYSQWVRGGERSRYGSVLVHAGTNSQAHTLAHGQNTHRQPRIYANANWKVTY